MMCLMHYRLRASLALSTAIASLVLTGCAGGSMPTDDAAGTAPSAYESAFATCLIAYMNLPRSIEILTEQSGEVATTRTPCDNWRESQGEDGFVEFWGDPAEYIPYLITEGKLEAFGDLAG